MFHKSEKNPDLIFGTRAVVEAIEAGREINKVFIQSGTDNALIRELKAAIAKHKVFYQYVVAEKIERLAPHKNHQGVVAMVSPVHYYELEMLLPEIFEAGKVPLLVVLDGITDVRNFGAIARSVAALKADALIIPMKEGVSITSDAIKTSAGALNYVKTCRVKDLLDTLDFLKQSGVFLLACTEKASQSIDQIDFKVPIALILGSEEEGISKECLKKVDASAKIELAFAQEIGSEMNSLNVSAAASIVLYEAQRQRK